MKCFFYSILNFLVIVITIIINSILFIPLMLLFIMFLFGLLVLNMFDKDKKSIFPEKEEEDNFKDFLKTLNESKENNKEYFKC